MKKYVLVEIRHRDGNNFTGWKYNFQRKLWEICHHGKSHWEIAVDTKTIADSYILYNFGKKE